MELAAVFVLPERQDCAAIGKFRPYDFTPPGGAPPSYSSLPPILGNDVVQTWTKRIDKLQAQTIWLTSGLGNQTSVYSALRGFSRDGVERFLIIQLKSYAEVDLADLIRFHSETRSTLTEAHDSRGYLGICVLSCRASNDRKAGASIVGPMPSEHRSYPFRGYAKRILSAQERQELIRDGLTGTCSMRPFGTAIRDQVWIGENVRLASSVRLLSPCYIGDGAVIRSGATIGPFASVEHDCVVDCGTTIERSTVLPFTYLASGLLLRRALVDGGHLLDLRSGAVVDLQSGKLGHAIHRPDTGQHAPERNFTSLFTRKGSSGEFIPSAIEIQ